MDANTLTRNLKMEARRLGFDDCRIVPLAAEQDGSVLHADFYEAWVGEGRAGDMRYLTRHL
jgi:hypothetical protein